MGIILDNRSRSGARSRRLFAGLAVAGLLLAACGSDDDTTADTEADTTEATAATTETAPAATDAPADTTADTEATADTTVDTDAAPTTDAGDSILGPDDPASGDPVTIGLISNGQTESIDNTIELDVADATVAWLNTNHGGIGGRPFELVTCIDNGDPAKAGDCANQMIADGVAAVVIGSNSQVEAAWTPLNEAGMPVMMYGANAVPILQDTDSSFVLGDPNAGVVGMPISVAEAAGADKVTAVVIDVPAALDLFQGDGAYAPIAFEEAGIELEVVPVPIGTADMTPQMQTVTQGDPGVVFVLGNDSFCISAFQGLAAVGFEGEVTAISACISDATRTAVPAEFLDGMTIAASAPVGVPSPSTELYETVMSTYGSGDIDVTRATGYSLFTALAGFGFAVDALEGDPTTENILSTIKAMPITELPAAGGIKYQCNGKAVPTAPASCVQGGLITILNSEGFPESYEVVGKNFG